MTLICRSQISKGIVVASCLLAFPACTESLSYEILEDGVLVREGKEKVLFYQAHPVSKDGQYTRANYIHPLYGMDGEVLTEDFPEDHLHHRGMFWAWHQVLIQGKPIGDSWECRDFNWDVRKVAVREATESLDITTQVFWTSPSYTDTSGAMIPFMEESGLFRVHPRADNYRQIDIEIALRPLVEGFQLGGSTDDKGYGGFSIRMKLPPGMTFTAESGPVRPLETAVRSGNWIDISGALAKDGAPAGIVLISKNTPPDGKYPWILREQGSMQNAVFPGREPVYLPPNTPTVLRYSLLVYTGFVSSGTIHRLSPPGDSEL